MLENKQPPNKTTTEKVNDVKVNRSSFLVFAERLIHLYYLVAVVVVVLFLAIGSLIMIMVYSGNDISEMLLKKQESLTAKQAELEKLKAMKTNYEQLEQSSQKILEVLPEDKNLPEIILQLEELARKNNLTMTNINIAEDKQTTANEQKTNKLNVKKVVLTTNLTGGDYFTLKSYLMDVEKNVRLLDIQSLAYSPITNSYDLMLGSYYLEKPGQK